MTIVNGTVENITYVKFTYKNSDNSYTRVYEQEKLPKHYQNDESAFLLLKNNTPFRVRHVSLTSAECRVQDENGFIFTVPHKQVSEAITSGLDSEGYFNCKFLWIKAPTLTLVVENSKLHKAAITVTQEKSSLKKLKQISEADLELGCWYLLKNGNVLYYHSRLKRKVDNEIWHFVWKCQIPKQKKFQGIDVITECIDNICSHSNYGIHLYGTRKIQGVIAKLTPSVQIKINHSKQYVYSDVPHSKCYSYNCWIKLEEIMNDYELV